MPMTLFFISRSIAFGSVEPIEFCGIIFSEYLCFVNGYIRIQPPSRVFASLQSRPLSQVTSFEVRSLFLWVS